MTGSPVCAHILMIWFYLSLSILDLILAFVPVVNIYIAIPAAVVLLLLAFLYHKRHEAHRKISLLTMSIAGFALLASIATSLLMMSGDTSASVPQIEKEMENFDQHFNDSENGF